MRAKWMALAILPALIIAGCDDDDPPTTPTPTAAETLALSFTGLDPLTNDFHYEGWAVVGGAAVSTGKFNVDGTGALVDLAGAVITGGEFATGMDLSTATAIVITIEPAGDTDAIPSDTKIAGGDVASLSASLAVGDARALNDDFSSAAGSFILATPTDDPAANENSGIWFLSLDSASVASAGLTLPALPAGWAYEGWVVQGGTPVSTGTFTAVDAADATALFSETINAGPPFPGEDFLLNAPTGLTFPTDLAGSTAVISIEPSPDDDAAPFTLKPLSAVIDSAAVDHVNIDLTADLTGFPTGTATIS